MQRGGDELVSELGGNWLRGNHGRSNVQPGSNRDIT